MHTCEAMRRGVMATLATVRVWHDDQGWGIVESEDTPGGCWVHFSHIVSPRYRTLRPGSGLMLEMDGARPGRLPVSGRAGVARPRSTHGQRARRGCSPGIHEHSDAAFRRTEGRRGQATAHGLIVRELPTPDVAEPGTSRQCRDGAAKAVRSGHRPAGECFPAGPAGRPPAPRWIPSGVRSP
jgi:cold shock CspA family protein